MRTEDKLVLLLAQGKLTPKVELRTRQLLDQEVSWTFFVERVIEQRVFPLVFRNLRNIGFDRVPETIRARLDAAYRSNALRNRLLATELKEVLQLLGESGIPVIPLKGLPLAAALYGDMALRVCSDIDILVPRSSLLDAARLLYKRGYRGLSSQPIEKTFTLRQGIECSLVREQGQFKYVLEPHWGLFLDAALEDAALADLWSEASPKTFCEVGCLGLSPEWEFLFLAAHAARHEWQGLKWLMDINELCFRPIDWEKLKGKAIRFEWAHVLQLTLLAIHELCETPMPPGFRIGHRPRWFRLFPNEPQNERLTPTFFRARLVIRRSQRLVYLARTLFVPSVNEERLLSLPGTFSFLYYPLRLLRLSCRFGWHFALFCFTWLKNRCVAAIRSGVRLLSSAWA